MKFDGDKPRMDLIPPLAELRVADVLTFGAKKYAPNNWKLVENANSRYMAAALRHLSEVRQGKLVDSESGLPHLAHAACCLLFMLQLDEEAKLCGIY